MNKFLKYNELSEDLKSQYYKAISNAFPKIISESKVIKKYWTKLERYFPEFQQFLIAPNDKLIGFINTIPLNFQEPLDDLPDQGWDWMIEKGIRDFESNIKANYLGGLQVIVLKEYQKHGHSKEILNLAKSMTKIHKFRNLIIPIRPTKKHEFPRMSMTNYLGHKENNKIYDPWIRTHLNAGAKLIKICEQSMTMKGNIKFWENILDRKIFESGKYELNGALDLISIDLESNTGQYVEPNIWIKYNIQ